MVENRGLLSFGTKSQTAEPGSARSSLSSLCVDRSKDLPRPTLDVPPLVPRMRIHVNKAEKVEGSEEKDDVIFVASSKMSSFSFSGVWASCIRHRS